MVAPILFVIYLSDLQISKMETNYIIFADATNLIKCTDNWPNLYNLSYNALSIRKEWSAANHLILNNFKTENVYLSLNKNSDLRFENSLNKIKFLGVILDTKLNWISHTSRIKGNKL